MCDSASNEVCTAETVQALDAIAAHVLGMVKRNEWSDLAEDGSFAIEVTHARTLSFTEAVQVAEYRVWSWSSS